MRRGSKTRNKHTFYGMTAAVAGKKAVKTFSRTV